MEDRDIEYKPPETISQGLKESMLEERSAADFYRRRGMHARLKEDEETADLYEHIAREEDQHFDEFKQREHIIMSEKEVQHWERFGLVDLNMIIGGLTGEGAIPVNSRETRKALCRGCRIDPTKPLEPGNCMVTTEDAIGTLSPQEVQDWCSEIIELRDGRCERARTIKQAAQECKGKYPDDTTKFFQCYVPAFAGITSKK
jgi:rubrerythrin